METKKMNHEIVKIAETLENLKTVSITTGRNGYPNLNGDIAVYGFETWEQCKAFSEKHRMPIRLFRKKQGWGFVEDKGDKFDPLSIDDYLNDMGDGVEALNSTFGLDEEEYEPENYKEIIDEGKKLNPGECIVIIDGEYDHTKKTELMEYEADSTIFYVGVLVPYQTFDIVFLDENEDIEDAHCISESFEECKKILDDKEVLKSLIANDFELSDEVTKMALQCTDSGELFEIMDIPNFFTH